MLREAEAEHGSRCNLLVLKATYSRCKAIETALASSVRTESRQRTKGLLNMLTGRVFHVVYELHPTRLAGEVGLADVAAFDG